LFTHTTKRAPLGRREGAPLEGSVDVSLALDFFLADAVRFIPVQLSQPNVPVVETNPGVPLHDVFDRAGRDSGRLRTEADRRLTVDVFRTARRASLTASEVGNAAATSGCRATRVVPFSCFVYFPRTPGPKVVRSALTSRGWPGRNHAHVSGLANTDQRRGFVACAGVVRRVRLFDSSSPFSGGTSGTLRRTPSYTFRRPRLARAK